MVLKATDVRAEQKQQPKALDMTVPASTVDELGKKPTWFDGDFANATRLVPEAITSGALTNPAFQKQLAALFGQVANQRKGDVRSADLVDATRRALVSVASDSKSTPEQKSAARQLYDMVRSTGEGWRSNPVSAPGYDASLEMPWKR